MKLIVGLGNPGIEYQFTPHNMGFLAVDRVAEQCGVRVNNRNCRAQTARARIGETEVVLAKPETFMNLSGQSVRELVQEYQVQPEQDLVLLYDELDLPFGTLRIRPRGRNLCASAWELGRIIRWATARSMYCRSSRNRSTWSSIRRWTLRPKR